MLLHATLLLLIESWSTVWRKYESLAMVRKVCRTKVVVINTGGISPDTEGNIMHKRLATRRCAKTAVVDTSIGECLLLWATMCIYVKWPTRQFPTHCWRPHRACGIAAVGPGMEPLLLQNNVGINTLAMIKYGLWRHVPLVTSPVGVIL